MSHAPTPESLILAVRIMKYLTTHQHAADTIEGIAAWWLEDSDEIPRLSVIQAALDYLVEEQILQHKSTFDNKAIYTLKKS